MTPDDLQRYDVHRSRLSSEIGLLLGNGEMGGLLSNEGLGFSQIWLTDYWRNEAERVPIGPLAFHPIGDLGEVRSYKQVLSLSKGIATTSVGFSTGRAYESEFFFSQENSHRLHCRIKNTSDFPLQLALDLPGPLRSIDSHKAAISCAAKAAPMELPYTAASIVVQTSLQQEKTIEEKMAFVVPSRGELECVFALVTSFDRPDFEKLAIDTVVGSLSFFEEKTLHSEKWERLWSGIDIRLPEGLYATTFYRSIYYTLAITGASRFLPGVCQFADPGWEMIPFSNDAGYIVPLLASLNLRERAASMIREFFKPDALKQNARVYLNLLGAEGTLDEGDESFCFAQMIGISGKETNFIFGRQRHLDGFVPAIFLRAAELMIDDKATADLTYQALKGAATFWLKMLFFDESKGGLLIRSTLDLDEKTMGVSVLSAVIACHWSLQAFAEQARMRGVDLSLAQQCEDHLQNLYWPQNAERLLSYPGDTEEQVTNKYNCLRSFSTLGYPYCELIEDYDREKIFRTMDSVRARNRLDDVDFGVNAMTTNMYALTEAWLGRGEQAYAYASLALKRLDESGVAMGEARTDSLFYCSTSYCTFALSTIHMLLQSCRGIIRPFPAVPAAWETVSFNELPAGFGILVSASMKKGRVERVVYRKQGVTLLVTEDARPVRVSSVDGEITLTPIW